MVLDRINKKIEDCNNSSGLPYKISVSLGFTVCSPSDNKSIDDYIAEADQAMYKNKLEHYKNVQ